VAAVNKAGRATSGGHHTRRRELMSRLRHPIRAIREPFGKAGLTVAILALVFAMVGGAYAASKLNSTQKKEVEKIAKKFQGTGPAGAAGAAGAAGKEGPQGKQGEAGKAGNNGTSVTSSVEPEGAHCTKGGSKFVSASPEPTYACNGEKGAKGATGEPWTAGGTLPKGQSEKGTWAMSTVESVVGKIGVASISYGIPLEAAPTLEYIKSGQAGTEHATECPGTETVPKAKEGFLCVYDISGSNFNTFVPVGTGDSASLAVGATMQFEGSIAGLPSTGSWAVTAE
jgi:hypothetical protein